MASNRKRIRDYAKEYLSRISRGLASGKSRIALRLVLPGSKLRKRLGLAGGFPLGDKVR